MQVGTAQPPWTQPDWYRQASVWIDSELEKHGLDVTGPIEQPHVRPWSTVLRVPTTAGDIYFKATAAVLLHEPVVTLALMRWQPAFTPTILATDVERGWMLMADGGTRLREVLKVDRDIRHWEILLPIYAELQIELVEHAQELLTLGAPNRELATLPAQYEQLLTDKSVLYIDSSEGLTSAEYQRLCDLRVHFAGLCEQLGGFRIPGSINHGDFHDGNVFMANGHYILFDWGDSCITHPFFSLRTVFVSLENSLQLEEHSPEFERLRDAYLEPWTRCASREQLLTAFALAQRLAPICSALGWYRVVSNLDESLRGDYAEAIPSLFQEFLSSEEKFAEQS